MSVIIIIICVILIIMLAVSIAMYLVQDRILFHAEKLPKDYEFSFNADFLEINLETDDGNTLNGLLFKVQNPKGLLLFYHNHSGNIEHWSRYALFMNKFDLDVLMMDYRGFGKSTGKFKELNFLKDSELWYNYALESYEEQLISVYGRGLGATFACYVASLNNPKQLCLESPFYSLGYLGKFHYPFLPRKLISKYKFDTAKYFVNVPCKIFIFHGEMNKLIHYKNSLKLYNLSQGNSELNLIPNGNHYNLINDLMYLKRINEIFKA